MNSKIKLVAVASLVAVMASGCSSYRGASQAGYDTGATAGSGGYSTSGETRGYGQRTRANQVAGGGQVRGGGQQRANTSATCAPCGATATTQPKAPATYTYKPAKPATPAPQPTAQASTHNQQYYVDKWNREQAAARNRTQQPAAQPQQNTNYAGYGTNSPNTQYYDYSSASGGQTTAPAANTNVTASNKSIYTGSYQQKTYKPYAPTTYAGGSAATTNTAAASSSSGGSSYVVKKGDTVFEIMRQTGVYWKDIISINNLQPPYNISPGQTIRLK